MTILNYSSILQGGGIGAGQKAIGLAGMLQQQKANEQKIQANEMAMQAEQKRQDQMPQIMQQAQDLYKSGDIDAIAAFSIENPQLGEQILKMRGLSQEEGKQRVSDRFSRIYTSQNPRADLAQEIEAGTAQGLDMSDSIAILESNATDDEIRQQAGIALASVDPSRQQSISKAMTTGQPKAATEYEQALIAAKKIDQDLRQQEIELKKAQAAAKKETDELKKEKLEQEVAAKQQALDSTKQQKAQNLTASITTSSNLVNSIDEILNNPQYIEDLSGISGKLPTITPSGTDAEVAFDNLVNQLTLDNLGLMKGVLTDRDIAVLRSAAAGLEKGMTKDKFVSQLKKIKNRTQSKIKGAEKELKGTGASIPDDTQTPKIRSEADILSQYGIEL